MKHSLSSRRHTVSVEPLEGRVLMAEISWDVVFADTASTSPFGPVFRGGPDKVAFVDDAISTGADGTTAFPLAGIGFQFSSSGAASLPSLTLADTRFDFYDITAAPTVNIPSTIPVDAEVYFLVGGNEVYTALLNDWRLFGVPPAISLTNGGAYGSTWGTGSLDVEMGVRGIGADPVSAYVPDLRYSQHAPEITLSIDKADISKWTAVNDADKLTVTVGRAGSDVNTSRSMKVKVNIGGGNAIFAGTKDDVVLADTGNDAVEDHLADGYVLVTIPQGETSAPLVLKAKGLENGPVDGDKTLKLDVDTDYHENVGAPPRYFKTSNGTKSVTVHSIGGARSDGAAPWHKSNYIFNQGDGSGSAWSDDGTSIASEVNLGDGLAYNATASATIDDLPEVPSLGGYVVVKLHDNQTVSHDTTHAVSVTLTPTVTWVVTDTPYPAKTETVHFDAAGEAEVRIDNHLVENIAAGTKIKWAVTISAGSNTAGSAITWDVEALAAFSVMPQVSISSNVTHLQQGGDWVEATITRVTPFLEDELYVEFAVDSSLTTAGPGAYTMDNCAIVDVDRYGVTIPANQTATSVGFLVQANQTEDVNNQTLAFRLAPLSHGEYSIDWEDDHDLVVFTIDGI